MRFVRRRPSRLYSVVTNLVPLEGIFSSVLELTGPRRSTFSRSDRWAFLVSDERNGDSVSIKLLWGPAAKNADESEAHRSDRTNKRTALSNGRRFIVHRAS